MAKYKPTSSIFRDPVATLPVKPAPIKKVAPAKTKTPLSTYTGGSSQGGLPIDYGGGGVMSSGRGTTAGHLVARAPAPTAPPHDPAPQHPAAALAPPKPKPAGNRVAAMQQFLRGKGYDVQVDGIQGPLTTAAAADWRASRNPGAWNLAHSGHGVAAAAAGTDNVSAAPPAPAAPKAAVKAPARAPAAGVVSVAPPAPQQTEEERAKAIVDSIMQPLIDQVKATEAAQSKSGSAAITGYTGNAIDQLKGLDFQAPYTGAVSGANAVNDAELALLKGQGGDLAAQVGAKLAAAGQNAAPVAAGLDAATTGASGADYAKGGATVAQLLSEGADAGAYGKKLPGIESLAGLQDLKGLQGSIAADTAKQLGDITAQTPQLIQSTLSNLHTTDNQDKSLKINAILASGYDPTTGTLTPAARKALAGLVGTDASALAGGSATTVGKAAAATATAAKISPSVSKLVGYVADADGNPIVTKDGKIVPVSKTGAKGAPKAPTGNELSKMVDLWFDGKATTQHTPVLNPDKSPVTDANGAPVYRTTDGPKSGQLNYTQAYKRLRALNVGDVQARQILDTRYARGDRGRAWLTNEEQTVLKHAGLSAKTTRYKTVAYLTRDQVTALTQAHKLPAGQWAGNQYVIDQTY
jgi:hypothetical protein